eukprot:333367-Prymnesium_polylepis.1
MHGHDADERQPPPSPTPNPPHTRFQQHPKNPYFQPACVMTPRPPPRADRYSKRATLQHATPHLAFCRGSSPTYVQCVSSCGSALAVAHSVSGSAGSAVWNRTDRLRCSESETVRASGVYFDDDVYFVTVDRRHVTCFKVRLGPVWVWRAP